MRVRPLAITATIASGVVVTTLFAQSLSSSNAQTTQSAAVFDSQGRLQEPDPTVFRKWVFVGAPLTPEGLNDGKFNCNADGTNCTKSNFPEYHHVYIERQNVDAYLKTGSFPEGTVIVKELTRVLNPTFPDGSRTEPSGRGYFNGATSNLSPKPT